MYDVVRHISSLKNGNTGGKGKSINKAIKSVIVTTFALALLIGRLVRFPVIDWDNPTMLNSKGLLKQCLILINQALFILIISTIDKATAAMVM